MQQEDKSVQDYVEEAFAAYRQRVQAPGYKAPIPRVAQPPPRFRRKYAIQTEMTAEKAFEWIDLADAYYQDRLKGPCLDASAIWVLYSQNYRHQYNPRKEPFPAGKLAQIQLTTLQWHDVFQRVKEYSGPRKSWDDEESAKDPLLEPYGLMVVMARKMQANRSKNNWRRSQGVIFLGKLGLHVGHMTMAQRKVVKDRYLEALKHPRTYL